MRLCYYHLLNQHHFLYNGAKPQVSLSAHRFNFVCRWVSLLIASVLSAGESLCSPLQFCLQVSLWSPLQFCMQVSLSALLSSFVCRWISLISSSVLSAGESLWSPLQFYLQVNLSDLLFSFVCRWVSLISSLVLSVGESNPRFWFEVSGESLWPLVYLFASPSCREMRATSLPVFTAD